VAFGGGLGGGGTPVAFGGGLGGGGERYRGSPDTSTGVVLSVVVPSPSWPL